MTISFANRQWRQLLQCPAAGGGEAIFVDQRRGPHRFSGALPADGDYVVQVYLMRSAARRNEVANYTITIGIGAATGATPPEGT